MLTFNVKQLLIDKTVGSKVSRVAVLGKHVGQLGSQARTLKHTCKVCPALLLLTA